MNRLTHAALRGIVVVLAAVLALLLGTAPAFAHTRLISSDPADGASLDTAPEKVSLTFNEDMQAEFSTVTVVGPDGEQWHTGEVSASGGTISTAVRPLGPAGRYEIGYRVVSDDGHPVQGSVTFELTAPGPGAAATSTAPAAAPAAGQPSAADPAPAASVTQAQAEPADDGGAPIWPWLVGAVVLVAGGAAAALRLGRT